MTTVRDGSSSSTSTKVEPPPLTRVERLKVVTRVVRQLEGAGLDATRQRALVGAVGVVRPEDAPVLRRLLATLGTVTPVDREAIVRTVVEIVSDNAEVVDGGVQALIHGTTPS